MRRPGLDTPRTPIAPLNYPWLSVLGGLVTVAYLLFLARPELAEWWQLPTDWFRAGVQYGVLAVFALLVLFDLRRFHHRREQQGADLNRLHRQLEDLRERNRQLQLKAHTYSGHADKLKYFISEKLLEYIEYDEKFLHFKGIAKEIRHNGIISFDKVQTLLNRLTGEAEQEGRSETLTELRSAVAAMRYLWDLLDLSTADNLSLHIGNHLFECEEQYCQRMLGAEQSTPLPYEPTYSPRRAAWRALRFVHPEEPPEPALADEGEQDEYRFEDEDWYVVMAPTGQLLGNENHLVLLLDNLLKNAQFFSGKARRRAGAHRIALSLHEQDGHAIFRVYNRGPHIRDKDRDKLFQLGFSTRRSREDHGRGLGLYFVNEIVKGYEGRIEVRNVEPPESRYRLELELADGRRVSCPVDVSRDGERLQARALPAEPATSGNGDASDDGGVDAGDDEDEKDHQTRADAPTAAAEPDGNGDAERQRAIWRPDGPIRSITVLGPGEESCRLEDFARRGEQTRLDPAHPDGPHWRVTYRPGRRKPRLSFEPLDIRGVVFEIQLPTARQRLEGDQAAVEEDLDAEMQRFDERFQVPEK